LKRKKSFGKNNVDVLFYWVGFFCSLSKWLKLWLKRRHVTSRWLTSLCTLTSLHWRIMRNGGKFWNY